MNFHTYDIVITRDGKQTLKRRYCFEIEISHNLRSVAGWATLVGSLATVLWSVS